jgi:hypothetical protein
MTFEPDGGGWNNIRMAMETVVGLAVATGRTLVLPPEQRMYLLRRGDFQFITTRVSADEIYDNVQDVLTENKTVYVATDERDKSFFDPLRKHYDLVFLDDFKHELEGVNSNLFNMLDQLIASRGNVFVGCWFSTFTGYINRIRGYHSEIGSQIQLIDY